MQLSIAWNLLLNSATTRALTYPPVTILLASIWLSNQVSAFLYDRQIRALGIDLSEPQIRARQPEQLPFDFSPQGAAFDDDQIATEVLLSDYGQPVPAQGEINFRLGDILFLTTAWGVFSCLSPKKV